MTATSHPDSREGVAVPTAMHKIQDTLLDSVMWICDHYGMGRSAEVLTAGLPRGGLLSGSLALTALDNAGLAGGLVERPLAQLTGIAYRLRRKVATMCHEPLPLGAVGDIGFIFFGYEVPYERS